MKRLICIGVILCFCLTGCKEKEKDLDKANNITASSSLEFKEINKDTNEDKKEEAPKEEVTEETPKIEETPKAEAEENKEEIPAVPDYTESMPEEKTPESETSSQSDVDIDLTKLSSTMVFGEVYSIVNFPKDYAGQKVRAHGQFSYYENPDTKERYYAVVIEDATACCAQGIEFVLSDESTYPQNIGDEITVVGEVEVYGEMPEYGIIFCHLANAYLE